MDVTITARHCDISQAYRDRITAEVEDLRKVFDRINRADIVLEHTANVQEADVTLYLNHYVVNAKGQGTSLTQAYGIALEKAERQLRKYKGKLFGRRSAAAKESQPVS